MLILIFVQVATVTSSSGLNFPFAFFADAVGIGAVKLIAFTSIITWTETLIIVAIALKAHSVGWLTDLQVEGNSEKSLKCKFHGVDFDFLKLN